VSTATTEQAGTISTASELTINLTSGLVAMSAGIFAQVAIAMAVGPEAQAALHMLMQ